MSAPDPAEPAHVGHRDSVDVVIEQWESLRPDLKFDSLAVTMRLARVRTYLEAELDPVFRKHGLSTPDFAALITLMRISDDIGVAQQRLTDELRLTPGTVSVRIDRLVDAGLAQRQPDPTSKRRTLITPTATGREVFERVVGTHLATEDRLLAALSVEEKTQLSSLLRILLAEFEQAQPTAITRLGLDVAPAHETITMRAAVGLPQTPGLLIRAVERDSAAARADLRAGDIVTQAGGAVVHSRAGLDATLRRVTPNSLTVDVLRGNTRVSTQVETRSPGSQGTVASTV